MQRTLGARIRKRRKLMKFSQDKLAGTVGINRVTLSKYERGIIEPTVSNLVRIASELGCSVSALIGEQEQIPQTISDSDIKSALFGCEYEVTDAQFEEVKHYALYLKERAVNDRYMCNNKKEID